MSQVSIKLTPRDNVGLPYDPSNNANTILLFQQFFKGDQGIQGIQGKSAYQVWLDDGHTGTPEDFINDIDPNLINAALDAIAARNAMVKPTISSNFSENKHELYEVPTGNIPKLLTDIWTVTRGSTATIQDACGLLRTVAANVPRITYDVLGRASLLVEEARTNKFVHPRNFNLSSWTKNTINVTGIRWFDNGMIGYKLSEDTSASTNHKLEHSISFTSGNKTSFKYLVFPDGRSAFRVQLGTGAGAFSVLQAAVFDTSTLTATVTSGTGSASIRQIGATGVYELVFITDTATSTQSMAPQISFLSGGSVSYTGDGVSGAYFLFAQAEDGGSATSIIPDATIFNSRASPKYVPDATGALVQVLTDVKAMAYNPANLNAEPVALYEVASTNLLANRDTMATETVAVVSGQTYTLSFDGTGSVQLSGANATNVVGLGTGLANQKTFTFVASSTSLTLTVTGSCLRGQLENLPYATSRIPNAMASGVRAADVTTGVQAARAADVPSRTLGKEWNSKEWSVLIESKFNTPVEPASRNSTLFFIGANLNNCMLIIRDQNSSVFRVRVYVNGSLTVNVGVPLSLATDAVFKLLFTYNNGLLNVYQNGTKVLTDLDVNTNNLIKQSSVYLGSRFGIGLVMSQRYYDVETYSKALTEAQAIAITS